MKYRRLKLDGEFLDVLFTSEGEFTAPPESHILDIATALGADPTRVLATESDEDPARGERLTPIPPTKQVEPLSVEDRLKRLEALVGTPR